MFSIPGLITACCVALIFCSAIYLGLFAISFNAQPYKLALSALVIGVVFAFIMPQLAIIIPVEAALGKNLRQSLDPNSRASKEVSISAKKLEDIGLSWNAIMVGSMLLIFGFITYYCVPLSFIHK